MSLTTPQFFKLIDLSDVQNATPQDGDVLTWDAASETWIASAATGGIPYDPDTGVATATGGLRLFGSGQTGLAPYLGFGALWGPTQPCFIWYESGGSVVCAFQGTTSCFGNFTVTGGFALTLASGARTDFRYLKAGTSQADAGAIVGELWRDTADNSVKVGV